MNNITEIGSYIMLFLRGGVGVAFVVGLLVLLFKMLKRKYISLIMQKKVTGVYVLLLLTILILFIGFIALAAATNEIKKEKDKVYAKITAAPSNQTADELIELIQKYGCDNEPNAWNKLRSVWITINESPNVSTEKKKQLKQFLMLQGLTMHYQDSKIIDNCKL